MKKINIGPLSLINAAFKVLLKNPVIIFPFYCLAFVQLLFIEIIYFTTRYPLSALFGPIIKKTAGPMFLHYPFNYLLLSKWFSSLEIWIYIFISCIFYGAAVEVIYLINSDKAIDYKKVFQKVLSSYFHLIASMILVVISIKSIMFLYGELVKMAIHFPSTGFINIIKIFILRGAPFIQLLLGTFVSVIFAFLVPIIVVEQKKIIPALALNFKKYAHLWGAIFIVLLITEIPYLPFVLIHASRLDESLAIKIPEMSGIYLIVSTLVLVLIDVLQYTAITLCYLFKKEEQI